ncbi:MAG: hypothetical protein ACRDRY_20745 [Pseudonocardiaceae bacterium]
MLFMIVVAPASSQRWRNCALYGAVMWMVTSRPPMSAIQLSNGMPASAAGPAARRAGGW